MVFNETILLIICRPVMIEVPNFGSLRGSEREIVVLRSENGETWREHTVEVTDEIVKDILGANFEKEGIYKFITQKYFKNIRNVETARYHY
jgi:hypothetical protein